MKKIINGRKYDTETAKKMARWSDGLSFRDFTHVEEVLYQKRTGEFFLHGAGGPSTRYARSCSGGWSSGEEIIPLTWNSAREWAEEHLDADDYEEIFGEVSEDDSRTVVTLSLSVGALEKAKRSAAQAGMTLSAYIESLI